MITEGKEEARSGEDLTVDQLQAKIKDLESRLSQQEEQDKKAEAVGLGERVIQYALKTGKDPEDLYKLVGLDGADIETVLDRLSEKEQAVRYEERINSARANGYKPRGSGSLPAIPSYREMMNMSDEDIKRLGPAADIAMDRELKQRKGTLRDRLEATL